MRGHDQSQLGAIEHLLELRGRRAALGDARNHVADRALAGCRGVATLTPAHAAHALAVLREVDELEPARQGAHENLDLLDVELGDERGKPVRGHGIAASHRAPERHGLVEQLDRPLAVGGAQDVVEHPGQERLVARELARYSRGLGRASSHAPYRHM